VALADSFRSLAVVAVERLFGLARLFLGPIGLAA